MFKSSKVKEDKRVIGQVIRAHLEKSKLSRPHQEVKFTFMFGDGVDDLGFVFDTAMLEGIITQPKKGTYKFGDTEVRGKDAFKAAMSDDQELLDGIWEKLSE
jgi:hypothetical protein